MTIEKLATVIKFMDDDIVVFPTNSILLIANDDSDIINVRLKASRKNVLTFEYQKVTNIQATSAKDFIDKYNSL